MRLCLCIDWSFDAGILLSAHYHTGILILVFQAAVTNFEYLIVFIVD